MIAPIGRETGIIQGAELMITKAQGACRRMIDPVQYIQWRRFVGSGWTEQHHQFPCLQRHIHAWLGADLDLPASIDLGQATHFEDQVRHDAKCSSSVWSPWRMLQHHIGSLRAI